MSVSFQRGIGVVRRVRQVSAAGALFAGFGVGGLVLALVVFPALRLATGNQKDGQRRCRYAIHLGFRLFVWAAEAFGLLSCEVRHRERLHDLGGKLVIANHPSLIDVILLISRIPNAHCVVKEGVWRNPFLGLVVRTAGYVPNTRADAVLDRVADLLRSGETVVLFPEGTRTPRGKAPVARRGAAVILLRSNRPSVPVHLQMVPRVLLKGESLSTLPRRRVQVVMTVGDPIDAAMFAQPDAPERANARAGARLLTHVLGGASNGPPASPSPRPSAASGAWVR